MAVEIEKMFKDRSELQDIRSEKIKILCEIISSLQSIVHHESGRVLNKDTTAFDPTVSRELFVSFETTMVESSKLTKKLLESDLQKAEWEKRITEWENQND